MKRQVVAAVAALFTCSALLTASAFAMEEGKALELYTGQSVQASEASSQSTYESLKAQYLEQGVRDTIEQISEPDSLTVLVNKQYQLSPDYQPQDLRWRDNHRIRSEAATQLERLNQDMLDQIGQQVYIVSGYRSYNTQIRTFNYWVGQDGLETANFVSARPGHSEHQTGLAVDVFQRPGYVGSFTGMNFEQTEQYAWLLNHAHEYGFILRYGEDETDVTGYRYEPWHWRYVGVDVATQMYDDGIKAFEVWHWRQAQSEQPDFSDPALENIDAGT